MAHLPVTEPMTASSRLGRQFQQAVAALRDADVPVALIGGLALAAHNIVRATQDVDFLADAARADAAGQALEALGYRCIHRSEDAANYLREDQRIDFIFARRPITRRLLAAARPVESSLGTVPVVSREGLIGLKLQAFVNDARRTQDLEDIRALLRAGRSELDLGEVRDYFLLFDREPLLEQLLSETAGG